MADVEYIADKIYIMKEGTFIKSGTLSDIIRDTEASVWEYETDAREAAAMEEKYTIVNVKSKGERTVLRIVSEEKPAADAVRTEVSLEDIYLYYFSGEGENTYGTTVTF